MSSKNTRYEKEEFTCLHQMRRSKMQIICPFRSAENNYTKESNMLVIHNQKEINAIHGEHKFRIIVATLTLLIVTMFLSACSDRPLNENKIAQIVREDISNILNSNGPLSESRIAQIIPDDILKYSLNGTTNIMTIQNLTIEKRKTNDKEDIVYVVINMEDSYVHRTAYYLFTINYWDTGGWILEKWEKYQDTISYPLIPPADIANDVISKKYKGYTLKSVDTDDLRNGNCTFVFDINDTKRYAIISGQAQVIFSLNSKGDNLQWASSINTSAFIAKWDIVGNWTARGGILDFNKPNLDYFDESIEASVNIIKVNDTTFMLNGDIIDIGRSSHPAVKSFRNNYSLKVELNYDNKNQQLSNKFKLTNADMSGEFIFNPDEAMLWIAGSRLNMSKTGN